MHEMIHLKSIYSRWNFLLSDKMVKDPNPNVSLNGLRN